VDVFEPGFCLYDDPDLPEGGDADKWSPMLRDAHRRLWSKCLPSGECLELAADLTMISPVAVRDLRLSSDTIATTHQRYQSISNRGLWTALSTASQERYDRGFYTIGGFIVFPCHQQSLNQRRGTCRQINDRFDLTLECIRLYYEGVTAIERNPLGDVLLDDAAFFDLFGHGVHAFYSYVQFFHLGDLVTNGQIRWFDSSTVDEWHFADSPLPKDQAAYVSYLENVLKFVRSRSHALAQALDRK